jgi:hypothetical protein
MYTKCWLKNASGQDDVIKLIKHGVHTFEGGKIGEYEFTESTTIKLSKPTP